MAENAEPESAEKESLYYQLKACEAKAVWLKENRIRESPSGAASLPSNNVLDVSDVFRHYPT